LRANPLPKREPILAPQRALEEDPGALLAGAVSAEGKLVAAGAGCSALSAAPGSEARDTPGGGKYGEIEPAPGRYVKEEVRLRNYLNTSPTNTKNDSSPSRGRLGWGVGTVGSLF
jgi:hypothetical protein